VKRIFFLVALVAVAAFALPGPRTTSVTVSGGTGSVPADLDAGVDLGGPASSIRVRLEVLGGNVSGGKLYCFYLPRPANAVNTGYVGSSWVRCPLLDLTVPTASNLDGGTIRSMVFPDLEVVGGYGKVFYTPGTLTGTADDAGTNGYTITTEAWGPRSP
jgi:hypothetical protein